MSGLALLVDPDLICVQLLAGAVPGCAVVTELAPDYASRPLIARVYTGPATAAELPEAQQRALVQLDAWASGASARRAAGDACRALAAALLKAQRDQRVVPAGHVRRLYLANGPYQAPAQESEPRGVYQFTAQLVGIFRPPAPVTTT